MVAIELCNKDTQPSQTCSEGYTFSATALYWGVSLFLGSINWTRLDSRLITFAGCTAMDILRSDGKELPVTHCRSSFLAH